MTDKSKLIEDLQRFGELNTKDHILVHKLNDFISLLEKSELNTDNIKIIKVKINTALDHKLDSKNLIKEIKQVSTSEMDKMEQLNQIENLLVNNYIDSKEAKRINYRNGIIKIIKIIIGFLFITLGFSMIIMPAPPYFEMFTIFYFTADDGVTLMDLISLIIIAIGTYIVLKSIINRKSDG